MRKRFKPKVHLRAGVYRIVETGFSSGRLEIQDGQDRMNVQRWRDLTTDETGSHARFHAVIAEIGAALAKRKRARRSSK